MERIMLIQRRCMCIAVTLLLAQRLRKRILFSLARLCLLCGFWTFGRNPSVVLNPSKSGCKTFYCMSGVRCVTLYKFTKMHPYLAISRVWSPLNVISFQAMSSLSLSGPKGSLQWREFQEHRFSVLFILCELSRCDEWIERFYVLKIALQAC